VGKRAVFRDQAAGLIGPPPRRLSNGSRQGISLKRFGDPTKLGLAGTHERCERMYRVGTQREDSSKGRQK
jgi:hypothetical protein